MVSTFLNLENIEFVLASDHFMAQKVKYQFNELS